MGSVGPRLFGAEPGTGKQFVGVGNSVGVKGAADELHGGERRLGEHVAHGLLLLAAYPVFASDGATVVHAQVQDAPREVERLLLLTRDRAVVENDGVEVAIPGVEDIGDAEAGLCSKPPDGFQQRRQGGARDDAVLQDGVRRDTPYRSKGGFAALPDEGAVSGSLGEADLRG